MKIKSFLLMVLTLMMVSVANAGEPFSYEIVGAGSGVQGSFLVKVFVVSKKNKPDLEELKKCAVHGVLFKGFTSEEHRIRQRPLAGSMLSYTQHADFYEVFFSKEGSYRNYVSMVTPQYEVVKMAKKQYRIGATMSVQKDALRKDLEKAGVIKKLGYGF